MYIYTNCCTRQSSRVLAVRYYRQANPQILAILFHRHRDAVFRLCFTLLKCRIEAEDATMEIFEYLQSHLKKYRIRHFYPWLMRFSRNHCLRILERRKQRRIPIRESPFWEYQHLDTRLLQERRIEQLHKAIDRLKRHQRECLFAFYFEERSYKEIAQHLQLTTAAVKSHIQNGKRNLRNSLIQARRE